MSWARLIIADARARAGPVQYVPQPTLAAVVIAAALSLADIAGTRRLWRQRRTEFGLSMAAFLGVALLGVLPGIVVAVALSILNVFRRVWWPLRDDPRTGPGRARLARRRPYPDAEQLARLVDLPVRRTADLRQRAHVPRAGPRPRRRSTRAAVDHRGGRAHHGRRHDGRRHARGARRVAQRQGCQAGVRRAKDPVREKVERYGSPAPSTRLTSTPRWTRPSPPSAPSTGRNGRRPGTGRGRRAPTADDSPPGAASPVLPE